MAEKENEIEHKKHHYKKHLKVHHRPHHKHRKGRRDVILKEHEEKELDYNDGLNEDYKEKETIQKELEKKEGEYNDDRKNYKEKGMIQKEHGKKGDEYNDEYKGDSSRVNITDIRKYAETISKMKKEVSKMITGQEKIVESLIRALLCDGHVLLEGVPGIAKTLAIRTLSIVSGCSAKRIQFTVDLLPSDIVGIVTYTPGKGFETIKGPIFANFLIADEINRSPSKTQSALIEAMQEMQVTIGKETFKLPRPFFVMATQNPIEQSGVYTLPEAQIDRFLFKMIMTYPELDEEEKIMEENITLRKFDDFDLKAMTSAEEIIKMQKLTKKVYLCNRIKKYILNIVRKTRLKDFKDAQYIEWGCSPRASIALFIASKAQALMRGRNFVIPSDVKNVAHEVLRHRIILTYRAKAEKIDSDKIIDEIFGLVEV